MNNLTEIMGDYYPMSLYLLIIFIGFIILVTLLGQDDKEPSLKQTSESSSEDLLDSGEINAGNESSSYNEESKSSKKIVEKAKQTLKKFNTKSSLEWLLNECSYEFTAPAFNKLKIEMPIEKQRTTKCFEFEGNAYELFCFNQRTVQTPDDCFFTGNFHFYFNGEIAIETSYQLWEDKYDQSFISLDLNPPEVVKLFNGEYSKIGDMKKLKLDTWVEKLPIIVEIEKDSILRLKEENYLELELDVDKNISNNFDINKYDK